MSARALSEAASLYMQRGAASSQQFVGWAAQVAGMYECTQSLVPLLFRLATSILTHAVRNSERQADRRQAAGGAVSAASGRRLRAAAAAGAAGQPGSPLDVEPTLVLAGFYIEEIAGVRQLLDEIGAAEVKVVPTTPERLYRPLGEVLATPEPQWDQPVPDDWQAGGGWGQQPMVLMAGLDQQESNILLDLLEESVSASLCPAYATPENLGAPLGEVLAAGLKLWRQSSGGSGGGAAATGAAAAGTAGGGAAAAAAEAAASDAAEGVQFIGELPPLEELLAQPAGQADASAESSSGGSSASSSKADAAASSSSAGAATSASSSSVAKARQLSMSAAPEVVQAEFRERPAAAAAAEEDVQEEEGGVPLDLIDAIATGSEPRGPPAATAAQATSAAPAEEASMSSEELLAAARAALGLGSADLQRLVDETAAKAAPATGVPFVPGGDAAGSSSASSGFPGAASPAAAAAAAAPAPSVRPAPPKGSGSSSPKPWETAAGAAAVSGASAAAGTASKGFGRPAPPSRKAAKAARRTAGSSSGNSAAVAGQPAAAAQAAPGTSQGAAAADARQQPEQGGQQQGEQQPEEGRVLPPTDQFVLSRAQLKEVTAQHGLDYEQLLAGLKQRGIELTD
ncbi:hypothetical protein C2E21_1188 [Chlorella sorokiniana]|uniref:Uncharacterized protein n=1 Tax=Chlorella sorokiniana TaxID=3076 RepID=A0A2P6U222_CHLSO|nr:hypothetical protein C2E21_1188 [Chlorella sorokiniana]|eukprot:PRW60368.1 hypothetical protein C2E21_1188 [Chlorella sorokiniana]